MKRSLMLIINPNAGRGAYKPGLADALQVLSEGLVPAVSLLLCYLSPPLLLAAGRRRERPRRFPGRFLPRRRRAR